MSFNKLKNNALFSNISSDNIDEIAKKFTWKAYQKNETVFLEKDTVDYIYIIKEGSVEITKFDLNGSKNIVTILHDHDMFAESVALSPISVSPYTVTSLTYSIIGKINSEKFNELAKVYPMLLINMQEILAGKNTFLTFKIDCLSKKTIKERVYELLRYYAIQQDSLKVKLPYNKTQLADFLCVNRSALARELTKMSEEGIFTYKNKTYLLNENIFLKM